MKKKKAPKQVYVSPNDVPTPGTSNDVNALRASYDQNIAKLMAEQQAYRSQYENNIGLLQGQYNTQIGLLSQQLAQQGNQYSLLGKQLETQKQEASKQFATQKTYYDKVLAEQQALAKEQQEAAQRSLLELESRQADTSAQKALSLQQQAAQQLSSSSVLASLRGTPQQSGGGFLRGDRQTSLLRR